MPHETVISDGTWSFDGGVDSSKVPTIQSARVPHGLLRNQLAWLNGGTVRDGAIQPRPGYAFLNRIFAPGTGLYQGGFLYEPIDGSNPYFIHVFNGRVYRQDPDSATVTDLSGGSLTIPVAIERALFAQGEEFLIIQAGDLVTLPLFWDGATLRRSRGAPQSRGVTTANFNAPAVGHHADDGSGFIVLTAPYSGSLNEIVTINGAQYVEIVPENGYSFTNTNAGPVGGTVVTGTPVYLASTGALWGRTLAPFVIPALTTAVTIVIDTLNTAMALGTDVLINGSTYNLASKFAGPLGANQVELVNLTDTPGNLQAAPAVLLSIAELPAAGPMTYYMERLWYAQGQTYSAGDIVKGPSGSVPYGFRDSILKVTENPLCISGDGFSLPARAGNIRGLTYTAQLDQALGQGRLYIFTRKLVAAQTVPVTRSDWIAADTNNKPEQTIVQLTNGAVNDISIVAVNGDLYYQSLEPGVRSLFIAVRNFQQPGNTPISREENRVMRFVDRALMRFSGGVEFQNRMLQLTLPVRLASGQVVHQMIIPMDFDIISSLQERLPPVWEGGWEGLQLVQAFTGDFGGLSRAFVVTVSEEDGGIDLWEIREDLRADRNKNGEARTVTEVEFPAFDFKNIEELKELVGGELWVDRVFGTVDMVVYWRPDASPCWQKWFDTSFCSARNCTEDVRTPCAYPEQDDKESYRFPITFPKPPEVCDRRGVRPAAIGFQHQIKIVYTGFMRIRGLIIYAEPKGRALYEGLTC